jgi:hypothetical protein
MATFQLPTPEECELEITDPKDGKVICTVDCLDVVRLREQAIQDADKLGMDDFWEIMLDKFEAKYGLGITHKAILLALYSEANDMLMEIKKKSSPLLRQLDSMASQTDGESES